MTAATFRLFSDGAELYSPCCCCLKCGNFCGAAAADAAIAAAVCSSQRPSSLDSTRTALAADKEFIIVRKFPIPQRIQLQQMRPSGEWWESRLERLTGACFPKRKCSFNSCFMILQLKTFKAWLCLKKG